MAWSTRQLAEIAGTTVKAVRHYHEVGLLDEPARKSNGYKQYGTAHLLRLLQIKRLGDLGVPLAQIASMGRADQDPDEALRVLDAELDATITRLQRVRGELAVILHHRAPADLPVGFSSVADELAEPERSMLIIYDQVFDEATMEDLRQLYRDEPSNDMDEDFRALPEDADVATRQQLAERIAPAMARQLDAYPTLGDLDRHTTRNAALAQSTLVQAMVELYNKAQLEVIYRAHLIVTGKTDDKLETVETSAETMAEPTAARTSPTHADERTRP